MASESVAVFKTLCEHSKAQFFKYFIEIFQIQSVLANYFHIFAFGIPHDIVFIIVFCAMKTTIDITHRDLYCVVLFYKQSCKVWQQMQWFQVVNVCLHGCYNKSTKQETPFLRLIMYLSSRRSPLTTCPKSSSGVSPKNGTQPTRNS